MMSDWMQIALIGGGFGLLMLAIKKLTEAGLI